MNNLIFEKRIEELSVKAIENYSGHLKNNVEFSKVENEIEEIYNVVKKDCPQKISILEELESLESIRANQIAEFLYRKGLKDGLEIIRILRGF